MSSRTRLDDTRRLSHLNDHTRQTIRRMLLNGISLFRLLNKEFEKITDNYRIVHHGIKNRTNGGGSRSVPGNFLRFLERKMISGCGVYPALTITRACFCSADISRLYDIMHHQNCTLRRIVLSRNALFHINFLQNLSTVKYLDISNNRIEDLTPLREMSSIRILQLSHNRIRDIACLNALEDLNVLDLSDNFVECIDVVQTFKKIKTLNLSRNCVANIQSVQNLFKLRELHLDCNQILDLQPATSNLNRFFLLKVEQNLCNEAASDYIVTLSYPLASPHDKYYLTKSCQSESKRKCAYERMYSACSSGHLHTLKWLWELCQPELPLHLWYNYNKEYDPVNGNHKQRDKSLLSAACEFGHIEVAEWLLEHNIHTPREHPYRYMIVAVQEGCFNMAQWLFKHGAHVSQKCDLERSSTPMLQACGQVGSLEIAQWLFYSGAESDVSARVSHWNITTSSHSCTSHPLYLEYTSPLYWACHYNNLEIAQWLHSVGAQTDAQCWNGQLNTPMHVACFKGHLRIVEWLCRCCDASVSCIDKQGKTPLHIACEQHHTQIVQFLCDNGADGNALSSEIDTPFLGACRKINIEKEKEGVSRVTLAIIEAAAPMVISEASPEEIVKIAQLLHKSGADIRRADSTGATPMWLACQNGPLSLCQFLYANGAAEDVRTPDRLGFTPMGRACSKGHLDIVQWLCTTSAKEDVYKWQNSGGATPFHVATRKGHLHVTSWLETMQPPAATSTPPRSSVPIPIPGAPRKGFS